jgi:hypothetical protein
MNILHEKSSCCRGKVRRFGGRRRQCVTCHRTWSTWQRKRGVKPKRVATQLLFKYLKNRCCPLRKPYLRARTRKALAVFIRKEKWAEIPSGQLIAIADAMVQRINRKVFTVYFILLKDSLSDKAVIAPPVLLAGTEDSFGWVKAFSRLPGNSQSRIVALACDGRTALVYLAQKSGWRIQRCHFHLRARISNYSSSFYLARHPEIGQRVNGLVTIVLASKNQEEVEDALGKLESYRISLFSVGLRKVISGFLKNYTDYRTYLNYPNLNLPTTTNSIESLIGTIREVQHRARGFSSIDSLEKWIIGVLKCRKYQTCNGKYQQK